MKQNKMWMRYFKLGVISCIFFLISCKKTAGYERYPIFNIINTTNYKISVDMYPSRYAIEPNSTTKITESQIFSDKKSGSNSYISAYRKQDNSPITIRFNNLKCLINQTESSEHSITNINNFNAKSIEGYTYKFTYTFTEADYNRATTCP